MFFGCLCETKQILFHGENEMEIPLLSSVVKSFFHEKTIKLFQTYYGQLWIYTSTTQKYNENIKRFATFKHSRYYLLRTLCFGLYIYIYIHEIITIKYIFIIQCKYE